MSSSVQPATLSLDDPKEAFLGVVRPGNNYFVAGRFKNVPEQIAPVLIQVPYHGPTGLLGRAPGAGLAFQCGPEFFEDSLVAFRAQ